MKKISIFFLVLISLSFATVARAQTHPCDGAAQTNPTVSSPAKVGFCFSGKNSDGSTVTVTSFKVYVGTSTTAVWTGLVQPIGTPSSTGMSYYETPPITFTTGNLSLKMTASSSQGEGVASPAFPFTTVKVLPMAPSIILIVK